MKLAEILKATRKNAHLTIREVQERTGISNAYINQLENGKNTNPSAEVLYKLCVLYHLPVTETFALTTSVNQ